MAGKFRFAICMNLRETSGDKPFYGTKSVVASRYELLRYKLVRYLVRS